MEPIYARSVSDALAECLYKMKRADVETSRNGDVLVMPEPVMTVYTNPRRRVLFSPLRNANPFFHLMEALWMLEGRNDLRFPMKFNKRFAEYSDDGQTIWGAYGWRWRKFFGFDQLKAIVTELRLRPNSRRAVLSMWNAMDVDTRDWDSETGTFIPPDSVVAATGGKDVPCNTHAYFDLRGGVLNMTVCNRSNDAIWGAYGANAVHFSILQEYLAAWLGVGMGVYRQFSNNLHVYTGVLDSMVPEEDNVRGKLHVLAMDAESTDLYVLMDRDPPPMITGSMDDWNYDLHRLVTGDGLGNEFGWKTPFFEHTVRPMRRAHEAWSERRFDDAMELAQTIEAWDWKTACVQWLERRAMARQENNNGK